MRVKKPIFAEDENGNEVLISTDYEISEISDAGPWSADGGWDNPVPTGWNVTVRITNLHWNEIVLVDAVELLKALEG